MAFGQQCKITFTNPPVDESVLYGGTENIQYFESVKSYCRLMQESLASVPEHIEYYSAYLDDKEKVLYCKIEVEYGRRSMQMCIDWAQNCIEQLERRDDE